MTFGGTFTLYEEKYDAQGHVTGVSSYTMTMPANPNTDTKVTQSDTTTASWRKVVVGYQSAASSGAAVSTQTNQVYVNNKLEYQPSSGTLRATQYLVNDAVTLSYNSTTKSLDFIFA